MKIAIVVPALAACYTSATRTPVRQVLPVGQSAPGEDLAPSRRYMCQLDVNGVAQTAYPCDVIEADWVNGQRGGLAMRAWADFDGHKLESAEIEIERDGVTIRAGTYRVPEDLKPVVEDYGVPIVYSRLEPVAGGWRGRLDFTSLCVVDPRCAWQVELTIWRRSWPEGFDEKMW